jgi:hypothetical protein
MERTMSLGRSQLPGGEWGKREFKHVDEPDGRSKRSMVGSLPDLVAVSAVVVVVVLAVADVAGEVAGTTLALDR